MKSLITYQNTKTTKGEKQGYLTGILYMAPSNIVDGINMCPFASKGCRLACLYTAGRGNMSNVKQARIRKTELFRDDLNCFMAMLVDDIRKAKRKAEKKNMKLCIRLNGTSDVVWENIKHHQTKKNIFEIFPDVIFYDYTKNFKRFENKLPNNYHLTFSINENNIKHGIRLMHQGHNIAMVFRELPETYRGFRVVDGDQTDLRFLDDQNVIVGLTPKGKAKHDTTGFVF